MADMPSDLVRGTPDMLILKTLTLEPKYYVLTEQGRKRLNSETRGWGRQVAAITRILEAS
jgi:hypothetical protein